MKLNLLNKKINESGGKLYYVGGYVRDKLLGRPTKDIDLLVVGIGKDKFEEIASTLFDLNLVGKSFGVYKVQDGDEEIDIALPRREFSTSPLHKDFVVTCDETVSLEEDLGRRDFTINAMCIDYSSLVEYYKKKDNNEI